MSDKMKDWLIKSRRLDIVSYWMQATDEYVDFYIEHMNLLCDSMMFGDTTIEPERFAGLAVRYER